MSDTDRIVRLERDLQAIRKRLDSSDVTINADTVYVKDRHRNYDPNNVEDILDYLANQITNLGSTYSFYYNGDIVGLTLRNIGGVYCNIWPNAEGDGIETAMSARSFTAGYINGIILTNTDGETCYVWPNAEGDGLETSLTPPAGMVTGAVLRTFTSGNIIGLILVNINNTDVYVWPNAEGDGVEIWTTKP
jgi:hypothetical protein